jgi:hypothetical protein
MLVHGPDRQCGRGYPLLLSPPSRPFLLRQSITVSPRRRYSLAVSSSPPTVFVRPCNVRDKPASFGPH